MLITSPKKLTGLAAALALAALLAPAANAQEQTTLNVTGHDSGNEYWFEVEGLEGRNPTITLTPGAQVTVNFENVGTSVHNLHFGDPINEMTEILPSGESETLQFTVPDDASEESQYWCDPHRELGMIGPLQFEEAAEPTPTTTDGQEEEGGGGVPGPGGLLALAAVLGAAAIVARRRRS